MITKVEAEQILADHKDDLHESVEGGFRDYSTKYAQVSVVHSARTRANIIHDHIVERAQANLASKRGVHSFTKYNRHLFSIDSKLIIHFKRLNEQLLSFNICTQLALNFASQQDLPGLPSSSPRLTVGYVPNKEWVRTEGLFITFSIGKSLQWYIDLSGGQQNEVLPFPETQTPPLSRRVLPKRVRTKRQANGPDQVI